MSYSRQNSFYSKLENDMKKKLPPVKKRNQELAQYQSEKKQAPVLDLNYQSELKKPPVKKLPPAKRASNKQLVQPEESNEVGQADVKESKSRSKSVRYQSPKAIKYGEYMKKVAQMQRDKVRQKSLVKRSNSLSNK